MKNVSSEHGFALVTTLMVLLILTLAVLISWNASILDLQIAGNDRIRGEAEFASTACQQLKTKQLIAGSGAALTGVTVSSRSTCQTDAPQVAAYIPNISGFSAGIPGGYSLTQMRFNAQGVRQAGLSAATSDQESLVQLVQAH